MASGNGQTEADKAVGPQPEDVRRKLYPGEYDGAEEEGIDEAHRGGGTDKAARTIVPFKLGG